MDTAVVFGEPRMRLRPRAVTSGVLCVCGGAVAIVASILPWWTVSISGPLFQLSRTYAGTHAWIGWASLVAGVGLMFAGVLFLAGGRRMPRRFYAAHSITLGLGLIAFSIVGMVERVRLVNVLGASAGIAGGQLLAIVAGIASVLGGVLGASGPRELVETPVPAPPASVPQFSP